MICTLCSWCGVEDDVGECHLCVDCGGLVRYVGTDVRPVDWGELSRMWLSG